MVTFAFVLTGSKAMYFLWARFFHMSDYYYYKQLVTGRMSGPAEVMHNVSEEQWIGTTRNTLLSLTCERT